LDDVVFVGTGCVEIDDAGNVIKVHRYPEHHRRLLRRLTLGQAFPPHSSAFLRAETLRKLGGYRTLLRRAQDWDLWLRLSEWGALACLPDPLVRIRKHAGQASLERDGRQQIVDSFAAIVSYVVRCWRGRDPLDGATNEVSAFLSWLETRLEEEGVFAARRVWLNAKTLAMRSANRFRGGLQAARLLCGSMTGIVAIRERLGGSDLGHRLAKEWVWKQMQCAGP
jgi:hypothetical protein